jgi:hypothetical protein
MRSLVRRPGVVFVDEEAWPSSVARRAFADVDTPDDLAGLGLVCPGAQGPGPAGPEVRRCGPGGG